MRTLCSSHPRLALVGTLTCRSRRNHAQLSGTCETRKSSRTSSTPAHVAQLAAESETDPLHQRVQAVDTTSLSFLLLRPPASYTSFPYTTYDRRDPARAREQP